MTEKSDPLIERAWAALEKLRDTTDPVGPCFFMHREAADDPEVRIDAVLPLDRLVTLLLGDREDRIIKVMDAIANPAWEMKAAGDCWVLWPKFDITKPPKTTPNAIVYHRFHNKEEATDRLRRLIAEQILAALEAPDA